jgi:hypothetical protein
MLKLHSSSSSSSSSYYYYYCYNNNNNYYYYYFRPFSLQVIWQSTPDCPAEFNDLFIGHRDKSVVVERYSDIYTSVYSGKGGNSGGNGGINGDRNGDIPKDTYQKTNANANANANMSFEEIIRGHIKSVLDSLPISRGGVYSKEVFPKKGMLEDFFFYPIGTEAENIDTNRPIVVAVWTRGTHTLRNMHCKDFLFAKSLFYQGW